MIPLNDTSVSDAQFREIPTAPAPQSLATTVEEVKTEQAAQETAAQAADQASALPKDFDFAPTSISKLAMQDNADHPDLIAECRKVLINAGVPEERLAVLDGHLLINQARGKSLLAQRMALNSFWHLQFASLGTEAYGARQLLVNEGNDADWIKWFSRIPLDVILKHDLPKA